MQMRRVRTRTRKDADADANAGANAGGMGGHRRQNKFSNNKQGNNRPRKNYALLRDKYNNLGREALSMGDRIQAEYHFQYADHYHRMAMEQQESRARWQSQQQPWVQAWPRQVGSTDRATEKQRAMAQYVENTEEEEALRAASMQVIRHARDLQRLAAARTRANALAVLESSLRRQTLRLRPYVLPVGTQCRVSYKVSSTVRQQLKVQLVKALRPPYTRELYTVTARHRRSELYLYDLEMAAVGEQGAAIVGGLRVQLPETLYRFDRRSIMPNTADVMHSLATRFPEKTYTTSMFAGIVRANGQDNEVYGEDQDNDNET